MLHRENVANVLEHEMQFAIVGWLSRVNATPDLIRVPLTAEERCAHLPEILHDIVVRLREPVKSDSRAFASDAAYIHGSKRRQQGYSAPMLVEESRMLQVSIFETLQLNLRHIDTRVLLGDVMTISDEVDSQLAQMMSSFLYEDGKSVEPLHA